MTGIGLLDGDDVEEPASAGFVTPHPLDAGEACPFHLIPDHRGFDDGLAEGVVGGRPHGASHGYDGRVAMIDPLHPHHIIRPGGTRIVAGPFAERTFQAKVVQQDLSLEHDLSSRWHRQAMELALERLEGNAAGTAGMSKLADLIVDLIARGEEEERVVTAA